MCSCIVNMDAVACGYSKCDDVDNLAVLFGVLVNHLIVLIFSNCSKCSCTDAHGVLFRIFGVEVLPYIFITNYFSSIS